jgi:hypothetical protein
MRGDIFEKAARCGVLLLSVKRVDRGGGGGFKFPSGTLGQGGYPFARLARFPSRTSLTWRMMRASRAETSAHDGRYWQGPLASSVGPRGSI